MSQPPARPNRQSQFLLTNLIVLGIFILILVFLIYAYPLLINAEPTPTGTNTATRRPSATSTVTPSPTLSPTITRTPRPTHTPTPSLSPTGTGTLTPTPSPTGPPTLTPAQPMLGAEFKLNPWGPDQADQVIRLLEYYPNTLPQSARGANDRGYYNAFRYAVTAQREAILRFPTDPRANGWRWGLAYNMARLGDERTGQAYAELLAYALNSGEIDVYNLPYWIKEMDPRLEAYLIDLQPLPGYLSSRLVDLRSSNGGAFIWLLETPSAFQAFPLDSYFGFPAARQASTILSDLTGDGRDELAIYYSNLPNTTTITPPSVYDLSQAPPRSLPFAPADRTTDLGVEFNNYWAAGKNERGLAALVFSDQVFPPCPILIKRIYTWNGKSFALDQASVKAAQPPVEGASVSPYCATIADIAARKWGPEFAVPIYKTYLSAWPPPLDEFGKPYSPDARDEWRYRLAVNQALAGDFEMARLNLIDIVRSPTVNDSIWVPPAAEFVTAYQKPEDIYRACIIARLCIPGYAIRYLGAHLPPEFQQDPVQYLWQNGVILRSSGYFDLDGDGLKERWISVRHHELEKLELWLITDTNQGMYFTWYGDIESTTPVFSYLDEQSEPPIVLLDETTAFTFPRDPASGIPGLIPYTQVLEYPNRFQDSLDQIADTLFAGGDPRQARVDLLRLQDYPGLMCKATWSCDEYYYLLGLSSELGRKPKDAVDNYLFLWWNYSKSPYTSIARLKMYGEAVPPTYTFLPTATSTPRPTSGPKPTKTASPTPSRTPSSATPTSTLATSTPSITPTRTDTPTGTITPATETPTPTETGTATATPVNTGSITIVTVVYSGSAANQADTYVEIRNDDVSNIQLQGWVLRNNLGTPSYTFPSYVMIPGKVCRVYTNEVHTDTCGFSFGSSSPIWDSAADCAYLFDSSNLLIGQKCYP
jgi:hypothetical protein